MINGTQVLKKNIRKFIDLQMSKEKMPITKKVDKGVKDLRDSTESFPSSFVQKEIVPSKA